jgi:hypothetical protein
MLVRQRKEQIGELLDLGETMREAQERLAGEELRQLARRRHDVVVTLVAEARLIARETGQPAGDQATQDLERTLEAALADPGASDAVRSGRLTTALSYSGFGSAEPGATAGPARPGAKPAVKQAPRRDAGGNRQGAGDDSAKRREAQVRSAEKALQEAKADAAAATRDAREQDRLAAKACAEEERLGREIEELEVELSRVRSKRTEAAKRARNAARARDAGERKLRTAEHRLAQAVHALEHLGP